MRCKLIFLIAICWILAPLLVMSCISMVSEGETASPVVSQDQLDDDSMDSQDTDDSQLGETTSVEEIVDEDKKVPVGDATLLPDRKPLLTSQEMTYQQYDVIQETNPSSKILTRKYTWVYYDREWTWELRIFESLYISYTSMPRPYTENYSVYITHPWDDTFIKSLVLDIEEVTQKEGFSDLEKIEFTNAFVQNLPYTADSITTPYDEYPRYPIETLVDNGGDCEDTSILLASLLNEMGYGVILIQFPGLHAAVGVMTDDDIHGYYWEYEGEKYYYIETTNTGWNIGECPDEHRKAEAQLYGMIPIPILTHSWTATGTSADIELEVTVQNLGTMQADDIFLFTGFDAGGEMFWNIEESSLFDVEFNGEVIIRLNLQVPVGQHTRLWIQIIDDGHIVSESCSEWFDT